MDKPPFSHLTLDKFTAVILIALGCYIVILSQVTFKCATIVNRHNPSTVVKVVL